jgi:hypothetical protein
LCAFSVVAGKFVIGFKGKQIVIHLKVLDMGAQDKWLQMVVEGYGAMTEHFLSLLMA